MSRRNLVKKNPALSRIKVKENTTHIVLTRDRLSYAHSIYFIHHQAILIEH